MISASAGSISGSQANDKTGTLIITMMTEMKTVMIVTMTIIIKEDKN